LVLDEDNDDDAFLTPLKNEDVLGWVMMMLMMMMMNDEEKCVVGKLPDIKVDLRNAKLSENFFIRKAFSSDVSQRVESTCANL
jgi:hypothetical protein